MQGEKLILSITNKLLHTIPIIEIEINVDDKFKTLSFKPISEETEIVKTIKIPLLSNKDKKIFFIDNNGKSFEMEYEKNIFKYFSLKQKVIRFLKVFTNT